MFSADIVEIAGKIGDVIIKNPDLFEKLDSIMPKEMANEYQKEFKFKDDQNKNLAIKVEEGKATPSQSQSQSAGKQQKSSAEKKIFFVKKPYPECPDKSVEVSALLAMDQDEIKNG